MKCLIIAAGRGNRLRSIADIKPLAPLVGTPLIERTIRSALQAGADDFYVVIGYQGDRLRLFLEVLGSQIDIPITLIENDEWKKANGVSVLKARKYFGEPFLLLMADHLFDPGIVRQIIDFPLANDEIVLAVDQDLENPLVDLEDVTRVMTCEDRIQSIGKGIEEYNGFDTGIFLCHPALFSTLERSCREGGDQSLSGGVRLLAQAGHARISPVNGLFWMDIDDTNDYKQAERFLLANPQR